MNAIPQSQLTFLDAPEASTLAREMAGAFRAYVEYHKKLYRLSAPEALAKAEAPVPPNYEERILRGPPDEVSWNDLEYVAERNADLAAQCWERIKLSALEELQSGHRAAKVMEGYSSQCWQRAQFLAIRNDLAKEWQPRNGIERQLIDMLAQAQTLLFLWQETLSMRSHYESWSEKRDIDERGKRSLPRVMDSEALEQAATMVERCNRIFLRTLRTLRELRSPAPALLVRNAEQLNILHQQVNVSALNGDS
jgi:hypothetical protein